MTRFAQLLASSVLFASPAFAQPQQESVPAESEAQDHVHEDPGPAIIVRTFGSMPRSAICRRTRIRSLM